MPPPNEDSLAASSTSPIPDPTSPSLSIISADLFLLLLPYINKLLTAFLDTLREVLAMASSSKEPTPISSKPIVILTGPPVPNPENLSLVTPFITTIPIISWKSKNEQTVSKSSSEAEYWALATVTYEL
ncbi:hypothetical protein V8G54_015485 [Vigna mungo]|uniref:Uncharacterized protein n=1 Tax=Vigna mungo TaxID=3915 RepID=A0AAQ3NJJ2_VIGMU